MEAPTLGFAPVIDFRKAAAEDDGCRWHLDARSDARHVPPKEAEIKA
jgi:hypothetical protein